VRKIDIIDQIKKKRSFLCTGLDTEMEKLPPHLPKTEQGFLDFNKAIVSATAPYSVSYKINTAFYEQYGSKGWQWMEETLTYLPENAFKIADAKRGDIGNTSTMYARAFFDALSFDAITVSPYMGEDSLRPFLEFRDKTIICLALTSNPGHKDFQLTTDQDGVALYERVLERVSKWGNPDRLMFVAGGTHQDILSTLRKKAPEHFFLVPGIGAQGGSLDEVVKHASNPEMGLLVNSSRGILYSGNGEDYAEKAALAAADLAREMSGYVDQLMV
jgi:orotidine-5'-phosphate decarboxylase